jgi:O-antigen/teichoic acid export membrane protein
MAAVEAQSEADRRGIASGGRTLREHTARGVMINAAFDVGLALLGMMRRVLVAIFLTASEYGLWGLILLSVMAVVWLKDVGIGDKYIQQSDEDQEQAFQKAFTIELIWSAIFVVLVLATLPVFALIYGRPDIVLPGALLALALLASALQSPTWIFYREMRFARQRALLAVEPVVGFAATMALAIAGAGYWSLVVGFLIGMCVASAATLAACPYRIRFRFERGTLREYYSFSWPLIISGGSTLVTVQLAVIIGEDALGLAAVGVIGLASNVAAFADRMDTIVTRTIYPAICAVRDRVDLLAESFTKSNRLALMWGMPFGIGLALFAPDFVEYVLGDEWDEAAGLLQVFGLVVAVKQIAFNWTAFHRAVGDTRPIAVNAVVGMLAFSAAAVPGMLLWGIEGYALAVAVMAVVEMATRAYFLERLFPSFDIARHSLRAIAPSLPAVALILGMRQLETGPRGPELALVELALYLVATAVATWVLERALLREVFGYLRSRARPAAGVA